MSAPRTYFKNLDGIRTLAFLFVYAEHALGNLLPAKIENEAFLISLGRLFLSQGEVGVSLFFVLSGFLITYLLLQEKNESSGINIPYFYLRRVLRIWPLYYLVLIFALLVYPWMKARLGVISESAARPVFYFTFLSNFDSIWIAKHAQGKDALSSGITWSVAIEEQFYLFWPWFLSFFARVNLNLGFALVIVGSTAFRFLHADDFPYLYFHSFSVVSDLAIGGLAASISIGHPKLRNWIETLKSAPAFMMLFAVLISFSCLGLWGGGILGPLGRLVSSVGFAWLI